MGNRYGRKQKRAHREMIADLACVSRSLQTRLDGARNDYRRERAKVSRLEDIFQNWDREIRSLLGPYSSFSINDATYRVDHPDQIRRMPILPPVSGFINFDSDIGIESIAYYVETIFGFIVGLSEPDLVTLRRHIAMRVMVGSERQGDSSYYAFSESMWHALKTDRPEARTRMAYRIASDLVEVLARGAEKKRANAGK